jgi:IMP and pyridine-specific 5'-nucleotidase
MHLADSPGHWNEEEVTNLLDVAEKSVSETQVDLKMRGRVLRKKRSIGLVPLSTESLMPREALDEAVLRVQQQLTGQGGANISLPFCAFNGGRDVWVDVGNKRVGVQVLQSYLGIDPHETLHIGDQFLNTGNDFAARDVCPCIWITSPEETTYILKSILRFANVSIDMDVGDDLNGDSDPSNHGYQAFDNSKVDFSEIERRDNVVKKMDVFTGEMLS